VHERRIVANNLRFHLAEAGDPRAPLLLLLHGFPEFWYSWRHQVPSLARRGFHVVAPDLRGYHLSDHPRAVADYDLDHLAADVLSIASFHGAEKIFLAGHDWGAAIAWHVAMQHPMRVAKLAILDSPPAHVLGRALATDVDQLRRSRYMFYFQLPGLAERRLRGDGLIRWMRSWATRQEAFSDEDLERYAEAVEVAGGLRGPLNYYRAAFRRMPKLLRNLPPPVAAPTLVLWGGADKILGLPLTERLGPCCSSSLRVEIIPGAGHFLQQEAPEEVNRLLGDFFAG
jgi:pimeloyl-ACP methyl ester carboxylesterase